MNCLRTRFLPWGSSIRRKGGSMKVLLADVMGMCFGVRDALKRMEAIANPEAVTIHGELVHNEAVLTELRMRGFHIASEGERHIIPRNSLVLITAHGVSD